MLAKVAFLREFATCGIILHAAQAAGVGRQTVQDWRRDDPAFVDLMTNAHEDAMDLLEEEARRRGHDGVVEPVYQGGRKVGTIRQVLRPPADDVPEGQAACGLQRAGRADRRERGVTGARGRPGVVASLDEAARATVVSRDCGLNRSPRRGACRGLGHRNELVFRIHIADRSHGDEVLGPTTRHHAGGTEGRIPCSDVRRSQDNLSLIVQEVPCPTKIQPSVSGHNPGELEGAQSLPRITL